MLLDLLNSKAEKIIVVVPEQSSFENEKKLLNFFGNKAFEKIKVLSFSRLFDFVSSSLKIPSIKPSNELTQTIMMNEVLENLKSQLKIYKKNSDDMTLAKLLLDAIKDLKSNKIDKENLKKIYDSCTKNILKQKLEEIIKIYDSYQSSLQNVINDTCDELDLLDDIIKSNNFFSNYSIFFYGFSTFTVQQFSIIETMMIQSENMYMLLCTPNLSYTPCSYNIFSLVDITIHKLEKMAHTHGIKIGQIEMLENISKFQNSELKLLEENIFRPEKTSVLSVPKNIEIYNATDLNEECEYVAQKIKLLVMKENARYSDFLILTRDMPNYSSAFKSVFKRYDIPYFLDYPEKFFNKNLTNLILSAFDAIHSDYLPSDILRYLKSGLTGISVEDISKLENYLLLWNLKSDAWSKDFSLHPRGYYQNLEDCDLEELNHLNELREKIIVPLKNFKSKLSGATAKNISRAVYELLIEIKADENLKTFCEQLEETEGIQIAEKHSLLWDNIMEILNQIALVLGNKKISSQRYLSILVSAIDSTDCSYVPQCLDNVTVSDISRIQNPDSKITFIVGAVNGEFPLTPTTSEIFTDEEINHINSTGVEFKENTEFILLKEKFLAYTATSSPTSKLYVSWPSSDSFKKSKLPSEIVKEIKLVFPNLKVFSKNDFPAQDMIFSKSNALEVFSKNINNSGTLRSTLNAFLLSDYHYSQKCKTISQFLDDNRFSFKTPTNAVGLFGKNLYVSASQIEKYYTCQFAYFCEYGLKAKAQNKSEFNSLDYGTLIHFLLEKLFKKYPGDEITKQSEETISEEITHLIKQYVNEKLGGWETKPQLFTYIIRRLKKSVLFLIKHIASEFKQSEFKIFEVEAEISKNGSIKPLELKTENGIKIHIDGKIDRIDLVTIDGKDYVRIVDYKTGTKQFKLSEVYSGINMQMLIYLLTVCKNGIQNHKALTPAAILYFTALKPLIDSQSQISSEEYQKEIRKKMKMNGLVLKNQKVILAMEKEGKGEFIPASIKDGEIKESDSLFTQEQLEVIYGHIEKLIVNMATNLCLGKISANPISLKNHSSCTWCKYHSICGYEKDEFKKISTAPNDKIIEKMKGCELLNEKNMDV